MKPYVLVNAILIFSFLVSLKTVLSKDTLEVDVSKAYEEDGVTGKPYCKKTPTDIK